jgi:hypothetical protein
LYFIGGRHGVIAAMLERDPKLPPADGPNGYDEFDAGLVDPEGAATPPRASI